MWPEARVGGGCKSTGPSMTAGFMSDDMAINEKVKECYVAKDDTIALGMHCSSRDEAPQSTK